MVREELKAIITELSAYLERVKPPAEVTVNLWFEEVQNIPSNCILEIKRQMKELETWPKNFPKYLWAIARQKAPQKTEACDCHEGRWDVAFYEPEHDRFAIYNFPCGNCGERGPKDRWALLDYSRYEREPDRYMKWPLAEWMLMFPDQAGLAYMTAKIKNNLKSEGRGELLTDLLPF